MSILIRAKIFAEMAHGSINQRRKYTNEPYINHPVAVANILYRHHFDDDICAAALLHDVVEDVYPINQFFSLEKIRNEFGVYIGSLVNEMTDKAKPEDGNRAERKKIDRERFSFVSSDAKAIKLADLIDNTSTIAIYDPGFAKVYLREKELLLPLLREEHPYVYHLHQLALTTLDWAKELLNLNHKDDDNDQPNQRTT